MDRSAPLAGDLVAHAAWARRVVRGMVRDEQLAEDLVQDALEAGLSAETGEVRNPRAWLVAVARRLHAKGLRADQRRDAREKARPAARAAPPTSELVERVETQRAVAKAVLGLPEPYRTVLILRFYEEEPVRRIAACCGESRKTIDNQLYRGLRMLRSSLGRELGPHWTLAVLPLAAPAVPALTGILAMTASTTTKTITLSAAVLLLLVAGGILSRQDTGDQASKGDAGSEPIAASPGPASTADPAAGVVRTGTAVEEVVAPPSPVAWNSDPMLLEGLIRCEGERFGWPPEVRFFRGGTREPGSTVTEDDGSFRIEGLAAYGGWIWLDGDIYDYVGVEGARSHKIADSRIEFWGLEDRLVIDVRLRPAWTGRIVDSAGSPVDAFALAEWVATAGDSVTYHASYCPTDDDGRFRVPEPRIDGAEKLQLRVVDKETYNTLTVEIPVEELPASKELGEFRMPEGRTVLITVHGPAGLPVEDARLHCYKVQQDLRSDEAGRILLEGIAAGEEYRVSVFRDGVGAAAAVIPADGADDVDIDLVASATVQVGITVPAGRRAEEFQFRFVEPHGGILPGLALKAAFSGVDQWEMSTTRDGRRDFTWQPSGNGPMVLTGLAPGIPMTIECQWRGALVWTGVVEPLHEGEIRSLRCEPSMPTERVYVEVVDQDGARIPDAPVACWWPHEDSDREAIYVVIPRADGTVELPARGDVGVRYLVHHPSHEQRFFDRSVPPRVVLREVTDFFVEVRDQAGEPLSDRTRLQVMYREADGRETHRNALPRDGGRFECNSIPVTLVTLRLERPDGTVYERQHDPSLGDLLIELPD